MTYPLVTYDLETINDYDFKKINHLSLDLKKYIIKYKTFPLELSCLYVEKKDSKSVFTKIKIKYPFSYDNASNDEKLGMSFYFLHQLQGNVVKGFSNIFLLGFYSISDYLKDFHFKSLISFNLLDYSNYLTFFTNLGHIKVKSMLKEHNDISSPIDLAFKKFIGFLKKYVGYDSQNDKIKDFTLLGKNNHNFDDLILNYYINLFQSNYLFDILSDSFDVQKFIFDCKNSTELSFYEKSFFRFIGKPVYDSQGNFQYDQGAYTLSNIYENLFHKSLDGAHDSKFDVIATYKIFNYYNIRFPKLIESSCQPSYLDLTDLNQDFLFYNEVNY